MYVYKKTEICYNIFMEKKTVSFYTLGCKVNQYETQALKEKFAKKGYVILPEGPADTGKPAAADIYVVNTCTVTSFSDKKSRQYIRRAKKQNPDALIAVIGCFAQVSPEEAAAIEGVHIVAGTNDKNRLPELIEAYEGGRSCGQLAQITPWDELTEYEDTGSIVSMDSRTRAFIKIQEGCNRFCSYCIIPYARGAVRSRSLADIIEEARRLIAKGFKELVLTGINTALYEGGVEAVVAALCALPGDFRVRLGSLEPTVIDARYAARLLQYEKLCPHMHLSLQSGSDKILAAMNRHYTGADYQEITSVLQSHDPGYALTADIIVGFPGEEDADFLQSAAIVGQIDFCKVHVFPYSRRKGTKAADMKGQVPTQVKSQRSAELIRLSEESSRRFFTKNIGCIRTALAEEAAEGVLTGHTENYIKVYFRAPVERLNTFCKVRLTGLHRDGMSGELV